MKLNLKDYLFVGIQFILFALYILKINIYTFKFPNSISITGIILSIIGALTIFIALLQLNTNLSPFPTPKSNSKLIQNGLFKYIRHPIYTGILLLLSGYAVYVNSSAKLIISLLLLMLFFLKTTYEEERLLSKFPNYSEYKKRTGRFLPKF